MFLVFFVCAHLVFAPPPPSFFCLIPCATSPSPSTHCSSLKFQLVGQVESDVCELPVWPSGMCVELVVRECVWCAVRVFCGRSLCCVFALFIFVCGCIGSTLEVLARQVVALLLLSLRVADASSSSSVLLVALVYFAVLHCSV